MYNLFSEEPREESKAFMSKVQSGYKALNTEIPEQLFKDFSKRCIDEGISKKEFIKLVLEKELYGNQAKK